MTPEQGPHAAVAAIAAAAAVLKDRKDEVNRLNVFPVPDGDTGTNMSLTMDAVMTELHGLSATATPAEICHAVTHGSLMGARGNSGVILSQILRGLCEAVSGASAFGPSLVAEALERSTTVAFQAVRKPVEGTMLTVLRDTSEAATEAVARGVDMDSLLDTVVAAAYQSLRRTPELLPVLKEAGVVDAGGLGLALLVEGFSAAVQGHAPAVRTFASAPALAVTPVDDWDDDEYLYCTEFLLFGTGLERDAIENWMAEQGGSQLVVGDEDTLKVHVHTDDPATVLAYATGLGEVAEVHINNMRRQTRARAEGIRDDAAAATSAPAGGERKPVGFVAVAAGEGLGAILRSLGVDEVVSGGQTMNPSTAELLDAAKRVPADTVVILPNNRNIVLAAQQVVALADRAVRVVATTSVPQAFSALLAFDPDAEVADNVAAMAEAAEQVRTGEVTTAVKDSKGKVGPIKAGQLIGIADHEIEVVGEDVVDVAARLVDVIADDAETLTILWGEGITSERVRELSDRVAAAHPEFEIEVHEGGQPLYPLILAVE